MILRLFRASAPARARGGVIDGLRDEVYPRALASRGLQSFQAAIRDTEVGFELCLISTWADFDALHDTIGPHLDRPRWLGDILDDLTAGRADHFESVGEAARGVFPLDGGVIRFVLGPLAQGNEDFFEFARQQQQAQLDAGAIVASHIGRRVVGRRTEAIYIVSWRDADAVRTMGGSPDEPAARTAWERYFERWDFAAYEALARVPARTGRAEVVLLADDARVLRFASPGSLSLLGHPVGRLVGRRIDDLAAPELRSAVPALWEDFVRAGRQEGPFTVAAPDGSTREVAYQARTDTPWPGYHASVLAPTGGDVDMDDALAGAGVLVHHRPMPAV
jgi:hypothetical protein